ncbi:MAG TPA: GAF domain-containing SpoIIE family protein phosphatase [Gaiellaceae bacterium]|nr:GAF domain-containing SpoIIE family protein phosphatase [Gaiellaceae bacterium]
MVVRVDSEQVSLAALARALSAAALRPELPEALADLAEAARVIAGADVVVVRVPAGDGRLEAIAVAGPPALAAELEGTSLPLEELPRTPLSELADAPAVLRRAAARAGARSALVLPVAIESGSASFELYRAGPPFSSIEQLAAELTAGHLALLLRAFAGREAHSVEPLDRPALELAGEALAAALGETPAAAEVVRVAATVVGAPVGLLWEQVDGGLELAGSHGLDPAVDLAAVRTLAGSALEAADPVTAASVESLPGGCTVSTVLRLGEPAVGLLQLLFVSDSPDPEQLGRLRLFGVRAAHALRANARARSLALELERTRALLAVVGQATAELSLAHTLETAVERVSELLAVECVAVYLRADEDRLVPAATRSLTGPHARVAERMLELSFARRDRALVESSDISSDLRLQDVRDAAREAGIDAALAARLAVRDDVIGLLAVYPERHRHATENEAELLGALAGQLAVAVQNAQLHERTRELSRQREAALASEREAARRLGALYEISRSFAQELSLDKTLDALAQTIVDVLDVDAALIGMPDERRDALVPRALHVNDPALDEAMRVVLWRPEPFGGAAVQGLFRRTTPYRIDWRHALLEPFLAKGWTGAVVPVATPAETIAALTVLSFRPGEPITDATVDAALAIAGQAALAIDNARLYQQQKEFADTMQRSLLPREHPEIEGLEVGEVYESSARVDVGGDIYDFLELDDGRLAVVLGDVTGHGVDATADMAMAKFVFRSLAREHSEPADFLASANDVVVDEIAPGKFITMTYVAIDPVRGEVACASAGHPPPRLVLADGTVSGLDATGIVLGIDSGQEYDEVHAVLPVGASIVLYTDGVIEARRNGELYGAERLDALLAADSALSPAELARAVTEDARAFARGEISDDLAVVVIRRTA